MKAPEGADDEMARWMAEKGTVRASVAHELARYAKDLTLAERVVLHGVGYRKAAW